MVNSKYELMVVGNPKTDSEKLLVLVDKALKDASATNVAVDKIGRKNLTFTIAKQSEGEYFVFNFDADRTQIAVLNQKLRVEQELILRYLLVREQKVRLSKNRIVKEPEQIKVVPEKVVSDVDQEKPVAKIEVKAETKKAKVTLRDPGQAKVTKAKKK